YIFPNIQTNVQGSFLERSDSRLRKINERIQPLHGELTLLVNFFTNERTLTSNGMRKTTFDKEITIHTNSGVKVTTQWIQEDTSIEFKSIILDSNSSAHESNFIKAG